MRYDLIPVRMTIMQEKQKTSAGQDKEKLEHVCPVGGNV